MAFDGAYYLIDDDGNTIASTRIPHHLRDAFDRSGVEAAWIAYSPDEKLLRVTRDTPNSVWNEFSHAHQYDRDDLNDYLTTYFEYFDSLEEPGESDT